MWQVPTFLNYPTLASRRSDHSHQSLAICKVGNWPHWTPSHSSEAAQVFRGCHRLLHEVGRSWTLSPNNKAEYLNLHMEKHCLSFRSSPRTVIWSRNTIWERMAPNYLWPTWDQESVLIPCSPKEQWPGWGHQQDNLVDSKEEVRKIKRSFGRRTPPSTMVLHNKFPSYN